MEEVTRLELLRTLSLYVFHYFYYCVVTDDLNIFLSHFLLVKYNEFVVS